MRRSKTALTPTICQRTKPGASKLTLWDSEVLGLGLVITPAGNRAWWFVARRLGKQVWVKIGEYQSTKGEDTLAVWTVDAAREEAGRLRKLHDHGDDIRGSVAVMRKPRTLADLVTEWEASIDYAQFAKKTKQTYTSALKNHILPALGDRLVSGLQFRDIETAFKEIEAKRPDSPMSKTATAAIKMLGHILDYGSDLGWREQGNNPCRRVKGVSSGVRTRIAKADELHRIHEALGITIKANIIRLVAVSGMRISETCALEWSGVNLDTKTLTITNHKTFKTMGPKIIPINPAMELIFREQHGHISPWVFRGFKGSHFQAVTVQIWWAELMRTLEIEGMQIHDLRRTFQTTGVELGYPPGDMDVLVGHKLPGMQATYVHLSPGGILAQASAVTSEWMVAALNGKSPRIGERVGGLALRLS